MAHCKRTGIVHTILTAGALASVMFFLSPTLRGGPSIFDDDNYVPPKRVESSAPNRTALPPTTGSSTPTTRASERSSPSTLAVEGHHAIPDRASRARCRKLFEDVYATELNDNSPAARKKLAQKLLIVADKTAEGSPDRFVLLNGAMEAAEEAQSLRLVFTAAKQLAREFGVDEMAAEADVAARMYAGPTSPALATIANVEALLDLADHLIDEDDFATAAAVEAALQKAFPSIAATDVKAEVKNHLHDFDNVRDATDKTAAAVEKIKKSPDDPVLNLAVGSYLCFQRGRWEQGLPLLQKSSDEQLRDIATAELGPPSGTDAVLKLADRWFGEASKVSAADRQGILQHAGVWYRKADDAAIGLQKLAIDKRLAQIPASGRLHRVDLLELYDPAMSVVKGTWAMKDGAMECEPVTNGHVDFPYQPPEEYDFVVSFTSTREVSAVAQICFCEGHQFVYQLGGWDNRVTAFEMVHGKVGTDNKTAKRKDHWLAVGQHYTSLIKVRKTGVEAYLDGVLTTDLKTDYSDMSLYSVWKLSRNNVVGIGASKNITHFDKVQIIEITGEGKVFLE
jgi:hypothetical protein